MDRNETITAPPREAVLGLDMASVTTFDYKFPGMRKPDSFIVYPRQRTNDKGSYIVVQGHRTIAAIYNDGVGWLNFKGSNAKYFPHLMSGLGADWVTFPPEFLNLVIEHQTKSGDTLPGGWVSLA